MLLGGNAFAQKKPLGANSYYLVTYYPNANTTGAPDGMLRIVNDGYAPTEGVASGNLSADIYVFDDSQELQECCSCLISADGGLSESVDKNLTANELPGGREKPMASSRSFLPRIMT